MKSVFLVFALAFTLTSGVFEDWPEVRADIYELSELCVNYTNIDNELVVKSMQGEYVDDPKFLEYSSCIATELGVIDEDGKFVKYNVLKIFIELMKIEVYKCIVHAKKETSSEKRSFEFYKCFLTSFDD
ncbi:PREDICTED: uncharacterized protein LOC108563402 [Nicrophorus vespilloides]|uniref:Uncharacterized protein LOC108563402 n=1 Tax=Nicrophorus vespilloides TaxID=110193 RepID=A0ABM1MSK2_NICVS|nr:PREDICTED: uncharacterized protein LOC108563402 [Nicrophorus vespilloides]